MGLFDKLKAKTPFYGIPIWVGEQYLKLRRMHPNSSESAIADTIFFNRYERQDPDFSAEEEARFMRYKRSRKEMINSLCDLCLAMYDIECQIDPLDYDMYAKVCEISEKELNKYGINISPENSLIFVQRWNEHIAAQK